MSLSSIVAILMVVSLLLGIANTIWLWWSKSNDADATRIKEIDQKLDDHAKRLGTVESDLKHLPNKEDVHAIKLQVTEIHGQLRTAESELGGVARTVRRIEDHLLGDKV